MTHDIPAPDLDVIQSLLDQGRLEDVETYCKRLRKLLELRIEADPQRHRLGLYGLPMFDAPRGGVPFQHDGSLIVEGGITAPIEGATLDSVTPPPPGIVFPDDAVGADPHEASNFPLEESTCIHCHHPIELMDGGWTHKRGLVICTGTGRHLVESWMTATPPDGTS